MISAFFNIYQTLDVISDHNKLNLIGIYMFKIYNKTLNKLWKVLIYKYIRMSLPKCVLLSLLLTWKVFLTWFLCFYCWLWPSRWLWWECCVCILTIAIQVIIKVIWKSWDQHWHRHQLQHSNINLVFYTV